MVPGQAPVRLARLVAAGTIDAPVAALAWLLLERGIPVLVAGPEPAVRDALVAALLDAMPEGRRPHAGHVVPGCVVLVAGGLSATTQPGVMRAALASTTGRSGLVASIDAGELGGVLDVLSGQGLSDDEVSFLGLVLVLDGARGGGAGVGDGSRDRVGPGQQGREGGRGRAGVVAAHYLRPVVRDAGGHVRRLPPAVVAAWDPRTGGIEDFAWGFAADLAERAGMAARDFEAERDRRAAILRRPGF